jgi:GTP cyclohydrolase FolE2
MGRIQRLTAMATRKKSPSLPDIQKSRDSRGIPIDQVGIKNIAPYCALWMALESDLAE